VLKTRSDSELALEPLGREAFGELRGQDLDDYIAPKSFVAREKDARHATAAELALQGVINAERGLETFAKIQCVCAQSDRCRDRR